MQPLRCAAIAGLACLAAGGNVHSARRDPVHLRVAANNDEQLKALVEASISNLAVPPVSNAAQIKGAGAEDKKGDKGDKGKKSDQPVQVQVPDTEIKQFLSTLSSGCGDRFEQMLKGKGGDLHTFGSAEIKANEEGCKKLDGTFCATQAHIVHEKEQTSSGRTMSSATDVSGNSCLPSQCMSKTDLTQLAQFMHTQAKNVMPGEEHRVELHVDCSKNFGPSVSVGVPPTKSGSTAMVPAVTAVAAVLAIITV